MATDPQAPGTGADGRGAAAGRVLVAQISDLHVVEPGRLACGVAPTAAHLGRAIAALNALTPRPDLVLISGDVTHDGSVAQAEHAARLLEELASPYWLVPGNHDDREVLHRVFGGRACEARPDGFICSVVDDVPGLRIIALDSVDDAAPGGCLCAARLGWLQDRLEEGGDQPTFLVMHHPPLRLGVAETDLDGFAGARELSEIVARFPNIERVLCGHIHMSTFSAWQGTFVATAPSLAMDLAFHPGAGISRFVRSEPACLLHYRVGKRAFVSHCHPLSAQR